MTSFVDSTKNNSLSSSLSKMMPEPVNYNAPSQALDTSISSSGSSITNFFANITWQTWLIVILILAVIGINIFTYLHHNRPLSKIFQSLSVHKQKENLLKY